MKAIMVMFDSLNRRFLEPYGCQETITPNFSDWHRKPCGLRTATPEVCPVFLQGESCTRPV